MDFMKIIGRLLFIALILALFFVGHMDFMKIIEGLLFIALILALFFVFIRKLFEGIMVVLHSLSVSSHLFLNMLICLSILILIFSIFSPLDVFIVAFPLGFLFGPAIIVEKFGTGKSIFTFLHIVTIAFCVFIFMTTDSPEVALKGSQGFFGSLESGMKWFFAFVFFVLAVNSLLLVRIASKRTAAAVQKKGIDRQGVIRPPKS